MFKFEAKMSLKDDIYFLGMESPGYYSGREQEAYREAITDVLKLIQKEEERLKPKT